MDSAVLTIESVVHKLGVTSRTLHYYEEIGLIEPVARTAGGHRLYDEAVVQKLKRILQLKETLGYSLGEIKRMLDIEQKLEQLRTSYYNTEPLSSDRCVLIEESILLLEELDRQIDERIEKLTAIRRNVTERLNRSNDLKAQFCSEMV